MNQIQLNQLISTVRRNTASGEERERHLRRLLWGAFVFVFVIVPLVAVILK